MKQFGLSKNERIKSKTEFSLVYTKGSVLYSSSKKLKANYYSQSSSEITGVKVAFGVHRKSGKAVWRNRIKRLLRCAFRLNKKLITECCSQKNKFLLIVISPYRINQKNNRRVYLKDVESDVVELMQRVNANL